MTEQLTTHWRTGAGMKPTTATMRSRDAKDFYPTDNRLLIPALECLLPIIPRGKRIVTILDPGCGDGRWGVAARQFWPESWIVGVDVDSKRLVETQTTGAYGSLHQKSFTALTLTPGNIDLVIGNPPYRLAEAFVQRSWDLLVPGGQMLFLLRSAFLNSAGRHRRMYSRDMNPYRVQILVQRPSFTDNGKTDATEYALFHWVKGYTGDTALSWLSWRP